MSNEIKRHLLEASVQARDIARNIQEDEGKMKLVDDFRSLADQIDECLERLEEI